MDIRCGGVPMVDPTGSIPDDPSPLDAAMNGTQMGKRYVDADDTMELLCVKPGAGSMSVGDTLLVEKSAKSLPSSD